MPKPVLLSLNNLAIMHAVGKALLILPPAYVLVYLSN